MSMRKIIVAVVVFGVAIIVMRSYGLSFGDLMALADRELTRAGSDTKELMSGEYSERMARQLREEAARMPSTRAPTGEGIDGELNRELAAERKRMLEERAQAAQKLGADVLKGDVETLKRQVEKQARQSGGSH